MNISLDLLMQEYSLVFIIAIITTVLTIMMRSFLVTSIQVLLLLSLSVLPESTGIIQFIFIAAQIALSGIVVYKIYKAIDMNYRLVLEKTHQSRPNLINDESRGSRFSFWRTN
ncbi:hypothetical protein [Virgibacillus litoralis]|uniref:DUF421 domain-containing protein n=1 Tax=Virgibacillus litoralis TaxID=578221 RepID=A0ABS4HB92_9BACI|nr:hypothetical protein [Virgibacillus litoralis]MBP1948004.1 hypothetical protein [Virgibacillus litoralis]